MRQRNTLALHMALLYGGQVLIASAQNSAFRAPAARFTPVAQVIVSPTGPSVRKAGSGFGSVDLGHISWAPENSKFGWKHSQDRESFTITTSIDLRLDCPAVDAGRPATIAAVLPESDPRYVVSLDQVPLSAAPAMIASRASCGATTTHALSLKISVSAPAGPIDASVTFQVTFQ